MTGLLNQYKIYVSISSDNLKLITPYCTLEECIEDMDTYYKVTSINISQLFMDYCSLDEETDIFKHHSIKIEKNVGNNKIKIIVD